MKVLAIIPARYQSSRFPGKPLAKILGKTMINRVIDQVKRCDLINKVIVATDDQRIYNHVMSLNAEAIYTSSSHKNGTQRCGEIYNKLDTYYDIILNIQGDEPLIHPEQLIDIINKLRNKKNQIATIIKEFNNYEEYNNLNNVKVIIDKYNMATSFYRQPRISSEELTFNNIYHHIGIYGFQSKIFEKIVSLKTQSENLEQTKWMEKGYYLKTVITRHRTKSVDNFEDIEKIENILLKNS